MTKQILGIGLLVAGALLVSEANAEFRYRQNQRYRSQRFDRPLVQSRANLFGGQDYQNGTRRVRSIPNIHGGHNFYDSGDAVRYRNLRYRYQRRFYLN